jgi:hypothetical protein
VNNIAYIIQVLLAFSVPFLLTLRPSLHFQSYREKVLFVLANSIVPILLFTAGSFLESALSLFVEGSNYTTMILANIMSAHIFFGSFVFALLPGFLSAQLPLFGKTKMQMIGLSAIGAIVGATISDSIYWLVDFNRMLSAYDASDTSFIFSIVCNIIGGSFVGIVTGNSAYQVIERIKGSKKGNYSIMSFSLRSFSIGGLIALSFIVFLVYWIFFYHIPVYVMFEFKCQKDCTSQFVPDSVVSFFKRSNNERINLLRNTTITQGDHKKGFFKVAHAKGILKIVKYPSSTIVYDSVVFIDGYSFNVSVDKDLTKIHGNANIVALNGEILNRTIWENVDSGVKGGIVGGLISLIGVLLAWFLSQRNKRKSRK